MANDRAPKPNITISINMLNVPDADPPLRAWSLEVSVDGGLPGIWKETFGSAGEVITFIRGVKAGCALCGIVHVDVIGDAPERAVFNGD